jgi:hypothetical protein
MADDRKRKRAARQGSLPKRTTGSAKKGHTQGGADAYKVKATETSVDYRAGKQYQAVGGSGPDRARSNASGRENAPVPGYSETHIKTSTDYGATMDRQTAGGSGPRLGAGKRRHRGSG